MPMSHMPSAAATADQAALAGLLRDDGEGPLLSRISIDRATAALKTIHWAARSDPDRWLGYHLTAIARAPDRGYRVRDGWVTLDFLPAQGAAWRASPATTIFDSGFAQNTFIHQSLQHGSLDDVMAFADAPPPLDGVDR
jgi:hypothetical protein